MQELHLSIGCVVISLLAPVECVVDDLRFPFLTSCPVDVKVRLHRSEPLCSVDSMERVQRRGDLGWTLYRSDERLIVLYDQVGEDSDSSLGIEWKEGDESLDLYMPSLESKVRSDTTIYHLLRVPLVWALSKRQGLLIHSCGVSVGGTGLLFIGPQESGKSTMASLWHRTARGQVLHDDSCVVRAIGDQVLIFGVPWLTSEGFCSAQDAALSGLCFLEQGSESKCTPLSPSQSLVLLLPQVFSIGWDRQGLLKIRDTCLWLVERIPGYRLTFVPDERVLDLVQETLLA